MIPGLRGSRKVIQSMIAPSCSSAWMTEPVSAIGRETLASRRWLTRSPLDSRFIAIWTYNKGSLPAEWKHMTVTNARNGFDKDDKPLEMLVWGLHPKWVCVGSIARLTHPKQSFGTDILPLLRLLSTADWHVRHLPRNHVQTVRCQHRP
jgi:hypothetical protein